MNAGLGLGIWPECPTKGIKLAKSYIQKRSSLLHIREKWIKQHGDFISPQSEWLRSQNCYNKQMWGMKALIHCWQERNSKQPLGTSVQRTLWKPKENYHVTSYTSGPGPKDSTSCATDASSKTRLSLLCARLLRDGSGLSGLWQRDG